jgi:DNA polymerase I-like protein with 3'-5' exonuclease and polymerase domains
MISLKARDVNSGLIFTIVQFILDNKVLLAVCVDEKGYMDTYAASDLVVIA